MNKEAVKARVMVLSFLVAFEPDLVEYDKVKKCALLAVHELIMSYSQYTGMYDQEFFTSELKYWVKVKEEINKL